MGTLAAYPAALPVAGSSPCVAWDHVAGMQAAKREAALAVALARARSPESVWVRPLRAILLYGPPGTGKTLMAAATAGLLAGADGRGGAFLPARARELAADQTGEAMAGLFAEARRRAPAVLFFDEIDALARRRGREAADGAGDRRVLSTLLEEMDGAGGKRRETPFVLTIAATNRPWDLDPAVLSRIERAILVPLPDEPTRRRILEVHLTERGYNVSDALLDELSRRTEHYSGRELERLCARAVAAMLADQNASLADLAVAEPERLVDACIRVRALARADFDPVLAEIEPQTTPAEMGKYLDWDPFFTGGR